jgi:iron(III) transport system substrate-binding protein
MLSSNRQRAFLAVGIAVSAMSLTACGSDSDDAPKADLSSVTSLDQVCKAGEKEGRLDFVSGTDAEVFAKEIKPFQALYPDIKINYSSAKPQDSVPRIVTEVQAGKAPSVDATKMDVPGSKPLLDLKLTYTDVNWAALGVPEANILTQGGVDAPRTQRLPVGLGYNTTKLTADELPDTWDELINSKWAGKLIVDPRAEILAGLAPEWGKDKAIEWYKKLLATDKPVVVPGATASLQKVTSGEALISTSVHDAEVNEQASTGAPLAIKYLDVVPSQDNYGFVLKGAKHPNAGACFVAWWASPDGGGAEQLKNEFKGNADLPEHLPANAVLSVPKTPEDFAEMGETSEEMAKLTAGLAK